MEHDSAGQYNTLVIAELFKRKIGTVDWPK